MSTIKSITNAALLIATVSSFCGAPFANAAQSSSALTSQQLFEKYKMFNTLHATIKSSIVLQPVNGSAPNTIDSTMDVSYKKPNLVHIDEQGLMGGGEVVSNGQTIYTYSALTNQYSEGTAPHDLLQSFMFAKGSTANLKLSGHTLIDGKSMSEYRGVIQSSRGNYAVEMYIDDSTKLFRRVVAHADHLPGPQGGAFKMTMTQDFLDQKINPALPADLFKFTPPSGAQKGDVGSMSAIPGMPGAQ